MFGFGLLAGYLPFLFLDVFPLLAELLAIEIKKGCYGKSVAWHLIIIEVVPAHVCEPCGERYFDAKAALEMDRIKQASTVPGERSLKSPYGLLLCRKL
ncbi:MAG: YgiT-type zinc finger protein [Syntrophothermus sp.]